MHLSKKRSGSVLVVRGESVVILGEYWVVTGADADRGIVWVARDNEVKETTAGAIGLYWEESDYV